MRRKCCFILIIILVLFAGCNYYEGPEDIGFQIACASSFTNGTINVKNEAAKGETVILTAFPYNHYHLARVTVQNVTTKESILVSGDGNERTFTMPADPVKVTEALFEVDAGVFYGITMASQYLHGELTSIDGDRYKAGIASEGETVTLLILPEPGYELASVYIKGKTTENAIPPGIGGYIIDNANKKLTFTMPGEDVHVNQTAVDGGPIFKLINGN